MMLEGSVLLMFCGFCREGAKMKGLIHVNCVKGI